MFYHDEGYYIIKFQSIKDMHAIYYVGHYIIGNIPIILKKWTPNLDFSVEFQVKYVYGCCFQIYQWIIGMWIPKYNCQFGSFMLLNVPMSYARMLIEVNVTKAIPT